MTNYSVVESPIGDVLLVGEPQLDSEQFAEEFAVTGIYLVGQKYEPLVAADWVRASNLFADAEKQLRAYFAGDLTSFDFALAPRGSDFQRTVWHGLLDIPFGTTTAYGVLAERVVDRSRTRAVAAAVGRNPIGIVVPCHRVIGADGSLTGYAGGLARKRWLLDHEAAVSGAMLDV